MCDLFPLNENENDISTASAVKLVSVMATQSYGTRLDH